MPPGRAGLSSSTSRAGPVVVRGRRATSGARTGARTGHAGTLDPFASGLLLVLSGAATRLAPWLVGLDKRYLTEIDLRSRTSTGDPEGDVVAEAIRPTEASCSLGSSASAERSSCRSPPPRPSRSGVSAPTGSPVAASPWRCRCGGRGSTQLDVIAYTGEVVTLDLRVSSGTYVRSVADALGGHCRSLRRTEVGPFRVEDADPRADPAAGRGSSISAGPRGGRGNRGGDPAGP